MIDDNIRDEKLQYDIYKEAVKLSALSSGKVDKYLYLTGQEILPSDQSRIIEQANFTDSLLGRRSFWKKKLEKLKTKEKSRLKLQKLWINRKFISPKNLSMEYFPKEMRSNEIKNEIDEIKKSEEKLKRKDLIHKQKNNI